MLQKEITMLTLPTPSVFSVEDIVAEIDQDGDSRISYSGEWKSTSLTLMRRVTPIV